MEPIPPFLPLWARGRGDCQVFNFLMAENRSLVEIVIPKDKMNDNKTEKYICERWWSWHYRGKEGSYIDGMVVHLKRKILHQSPFEYWKLLPSNCANWSFWSRQVKSCQLSAGVDHSLIGRWYMRITWYLLWPKIIICPWDRGYRWRRTIFYNSLMVISPMQWKHNL